MTAFAKTIVVRLCAYYILYVDIYIAFVYTYAFDGSVVSCVPITIFVHT